jgi:hypothetical protein
MARKFLTPIDLNKLELQNAVIQNLAVAPANPVEGQVYYNTDEDKIKVFSGSTWDNVGSSQEEIEDYVAGLLAGGNGISLTYDDSGNILTIANTGVLSLAGTNNEVNVSASVGAVTISLPDTIHANVLGNVTGNLTGNADTATKLATARTIALTGDVSGSTTFDGSASASINVTIEANSVALGTDTTGNYVAGISGTANEIEVSGSGSEGSTVTIGLPNDVTVPNNLTVGGNLTVSGSVTYVNSETVEIADNIILLNSNAEGTPTENAGIEVKRGTSANVSIQWNETADRWSLTNDGTNYHVIAKKFAVTIGNTEDTSYTVTHNMGTKDVTVNVYSMSTDETVETDIVRASVDTVTIGFASAPGTDSYRVVIVG